MGKLSVDKKKGVWIKIENKCDLSYSFFSVSCQSIQECTLTKQAMVAHSKIVCSTVQHSQKRKPVKSCVPCIMVEVKGLMSCFLCRNY